MSEFTGPVPGGSPAEQAVFLSGLLAEHGVSSLRFELDGHGEELTARRTDLPGVIIRACAGGRGELVAAPLDLRIELRETGLRWRTAWPETAALLR